MKSTLIFSLAILLTYASCAQAILFQQNFSAGGVSSNYVSNAPTNTQFDGISGATIVNGALQFAKVAVTNTGHFARNTNLTPASNTLYIQMSVEIIRQSTVAAENALTFYVGDGFTSTVGNPANNLVHSRFGINLLTTGNGFSFKHVEAMDSRSKISSVFTGKQFLTFVVNHSGSTTRYLQPTGGTDTLADGRYDLWVGTVHVFDGFLSLAPTQNLRHFKLRYDNRGDATVQFDSLLIRDISGALPISTADLKAVVADSHVNLAWQYGQQSAAIFTVERSLDALEFVAIGSIPTAEHPDEQHSYSFTDNAPTAGINYYRLKKTCADGNTTVSKIVAVDVPTYVPDLIMLDNPSEGSAISMRSQNLTDAMYQLVTLTGQPITCQQRKTPDGLVTLLPQRPLPSGVYLVTATTETTRITRRVQVR